MTLRISRCKSCDARIVWMVTDSGKNTPVNAESVDEAEIELDDEGKPIYDQELGHESHFATCPEAEKWRHRF